MGLKDSAADLLRHIFAVQIDWLVVWLSATYQSTVQEFS